MKQLDRDRYPLSHDNNIHGYSVNGSTTASKTGSKGSSPFIRAIGRIAKW